MKKFLIVMVLFCAKSLANNDLGVDYYYGNKVAVDYDKAFALIKKSADNGEPVAQYNLGALYALGRGTESSGKKSAALFKASAESGYSRGEFAHSRIVYWEDGGKQKAFNWAYKAAKKNNGEAQAYIGREYYLNFDTPNAIYWLEAAAKKGWVEAQYLLGVVYENEYQISNNRSSLISAYVWHEVASKNNDELSKKRRSKIAMFLTGDELIKARIIAEDLRVQPKFTGPHRLFKTFESR